MSMLDALFGRTKPKQPNLDVLFALPSAAVTLEEAGLHPTGRAAVAFKPASGEGFADMRRELDQLLQRSASDSGTALRQDDDSYGYHWVVLDDPQLEDLVGAVHLVNATLTDKGFGPQLLCAVFAFSPSASASIPAPGSAPASTSGQAPAPASQPDESVCLVYLYKRGTFYPFAPRPGERRDNEAELRVRAILGNQLPIEPDLGRWFPLWGAPIS
ncbi:MAG: hypothetical protein M3O91_10475 [Chloroflexota bacterium]|nr:hypothetical protein [Chloroflexota bacterium]